MPKVVDHGERRASIVAAAQRSIATGGLDGATMRKIAESASCTTGLLSHYFDSRDEILLAALTAAHDAAGARMAAVVAARADPVSALCDVLLEALPLDDLRRSEWLVWIAFWSQAVSSEPLRAEHLGRYREWRASLAQLLGNAAAERSCELDADEEALRLSAMIDGLGLQMTLGQEAGDADRAKRIIDHHVETLGLNLAE